MTPTEPLCRLYLITPPTLPDLDSFIASLYQALSGGDVAALQVRLKGVGDATVAEAVRAVQPLCAAHGVAVILNDRADLAAALHCDGVHLGQADGSVADARRLLGRERMIGVTCHDSRDLAYDAAEAGADYVAFGAFHPTTTKQVLHQADPELLSIWQETMQIPCVAIGGITAQTARALAAAGADFLAVSAGVWAHPKGPAEAVRAFNAEMAAGVATRG